MNAFVHGRRKTVSLFDEMSFPGLIGYLSNGAIIAASALGCVDGTRWRVLVSVFFFYFGLFLFIGLMKMVEFVDME